ncbi:MAG: iron-containing alcohol dehydrogenase [Desulfarculaceae bacterium]|nr:iron-containing alcohol dehydrogenase [Desulfarculaceae bacterium]
MANQFATEGIKRMVFGRGSAAKLGEELGLIKAEKVLLVLDPNLAESDIIKPALDSLAAAGISSEVFSDLTREPEPAEADAAAAQGRACGAQAVVGIGGGSALDLAKAAGVLITNPGQCTDYVGLDKVTQPGLPVICLPTTAGTGSEVTFTAVFTRRSDQFKGGINGRLLYPHAAILDPLLTVSCPAYVTAITGMDALTHAMEAFTSRKAHALSDLNALAAIELIGRHLRAAVAHGENLQAREGMMLGSHLAGLALAQAGVGAVHAMAYPLGAFYDIPHGEANALLLPYVLRFNLMACPERFADMAYALAELPDDLSTAEAAAACIEEVAELGLDVGIPTSLRQLDIPEDSVPKMAEKAMTVAVPIANNPRQVTAQDLEIIYREAFI